VWDAVTRWFHWINVLCVIGLAAVGLVILNAKGLDLPNSGKAALKVVHTWIGYAFAINLLWRVVWAFLGNRYARWRALLPGGPGYLRALRSYVAAFLSGAPHHYLGHNPVGRIAVTLMLALLLIQALTGLVLAGTDIFYPPLGAWIAQWIAAPGVDPAGLLPYSPEMYDPSAYESMRALRKPVATVHLYGFYALGVVVALHVAGVVATELREGGNIVSAMFTGRKTAAGQVEDES
jgi:cytochrome b